jgi:hypothetical protein
MDDIHSKVKMEAMEDVEVMLFADDLVAWSEHEEVLQRYIDLWNRNIEEAGMKISIIKSEVVTMPGEGDTGNYQAQINVGRRNPESGG